MPPPDLDSAVPKLSSNDIELKAEEVIMHFDASLLTMAKSTPILEFAIETKRQFGVDFRADLDLGHSSSGRKYLGQFRVKPPGVFIDASLQDSDRMPFTLAHEYGHLVLHRKVDPVKSGYANSTLDDTEHDLFTGKKILSTPRDWIEWQANRFASAILMPRATFSDALIDFHKAQGIRRNVGIVVVNGTLPSKADFAHVVGHLSVIYGVNRTNIECRLRDLELLQDHRVAQTHHISALFKEE